MSSQKTDTTYTSPLEGALFQPAASLLNSLSYSRKFILIATVTLALLFSITYLAFSLASERIDLTRREDTGLEYIRPCVALLRQAQKHGVFEVALVTGDVRYAERLDGVPGSSNRGVRAEIEETLQAIDAMEKKLGAELGTSEAVKTIRSQWQTIVSLRGSKDVYKTLNAHLQLLNGIHGLIRVAASNSQMVHDPEAESYWLMQAYTQTTPRLTNAMARAAMVCADISRRNEISVQDRISISAAYQEGRSAANELVFINMESAYAAADIKARLATGAEKTRQEEVVKKITDYTKAAHKQSEAFLSFIREKVRDADKVEFEALDLDGLSSEVAETMQGFFANIETALVEILDAREQQYTSQQFIGAGIALVATLFLIYVFGALSFAVRKSIQELGGATQRMIAGTSETFTLNTRDELAKVAISYNEINAALVESRNLKSKVEEENRMLQENILQTLQFVAKAADGDLTVRARVTEGALGNVADAFNQMLESWRDLLSEIRSLSDNTQNAISAIGSASQTMANGANQQFRELIHARGSVQKMNESIQHVSTNADTATEAARRTQESALTGTDSVQKVVAGMDQLRSSVQAGAKKIKSLGDRSMEITSIVATIAKISDQTNMLALNAAIEAARAGEHGRGFSVVAEEIRKLAERTALATQEIEKLVQMIQAETNESVAAIEQQTHFVETEVEMVSQAGEALTRISDVSSQSAKLVQDINATAKAHVQDATNAAKAMERVSEIARQTEVGIEQTLKTIQDLAQVSDQLNTSIGRFRLEDAHSAKVRAAADRVRIQAKRRSEAVVPSGVGE